VTKLPAGWAWSKLGDVCDVVLGQSPPGSSYNDSGDGIAFFQGKSDFGEILTTVRKWTTDPRKLANQGHVLISVRAPVGPTNLASTNCAIGRGLAALGSRHLDHRCLLWAVRSSEHRLASQAAGTTFPAVSGSQLRAHLIPVPPRAEQRRIVAAIEEHFSRLDAAEAALRSAEHRLSLMRASLIEDATRCDWPMKPLNEVVLSLRNGCFVSRPGIEPKGLPILRISAVRPLTLDTNDVRYAPASLGRVPDYQIMPGDVLFTRYSGNPDYVGACATVPPQGAGLLHPDKLIRGIPDPAVAIGPWVALAVTAASGRREIEKRLKTTAGQVGISGSQLKTVPIPVPPLAEQADRVARWERCADAMTRLRSEVALAARRSARIRRSVLAAAFSGQLVAQDPTDEPAGQLLERIRADRAAQVPSRRPRRTSTP